MDFILQHDWLHRGTESAEFLTERVLLRSNLYRIISGTFRDPLISDDDSEEDQEHDINAMLQEVKSQTRTKKERPKRAFVPGMRPLPCFPRQSSLSKEQHFRGLRLVAESDTTMSTFSSYHSSRADKQAYEEMLEAYQMEQKEFLAWAAREWVERHCVRALRPLPVLERMYSAEWSARVASAASLPVHYEYGAQIDLSAGGEVDLIHQADLKKVQVSRLPTIELPVLNSDQSVASPLPDEYLPRACRRHPCRIVMPDEERTCTLPLREVHSQLGMYAARHDAAVVMSERALRCLVQTDTEWNLPVTVEQIFTPKGMRTVVVVDSEVRPRREYTRARNARALHLLLRHMLTRNSKSYTSTEQSERPTSTVPRESAECATNDRAEPESSDDEDGLRIDFDDGDRNCKENISHERRLSKEDEKNPAGISKSAQSTADTERRHLKGIPTGDVHMSQLSDNCTCKGTPFESPPHISYKKWLLKSKTTEDVIPVIIHCSHKHSKDEKTEVMLNVIPEYQIDIGGSAVPAGKLRSCALALQLRDNTIMLSARIDATNGQIVTLEYKDRSQIEAEYKAEHGTGPTEQAIASIHKVLTQLCQLKPNRYVLQHEPKHGDNALLFVMARPSGAEHTLSLTVNHDLDDDSETKHLQTPPVLCAAVLPIHKMRKMMPLAFSPYPPKKKPKPPSNAEKKKAAILKFKKEKNAMKRARHRQKKRTAKSVTENT